MAAPLHIALALGQTVSFALPPPAGPLVAATLQFIDMMTGDTPADPNKPVLDAITTQTEQLENFLVTLNLATLKNQLNVIGGSVGISQNELTKATSQGTDELRDQLRSLLDHQLDWLLETDNPSETALWSLLNMRFTTADRYELHKTAVDLYTDLLMSLICLFKLRCELQSQYVSLSTQDTDSSSTMTATDIAQVYTELNVFWAHLDYWTQPGGTAQPTATQKALGVTQSAPASATLGPLDTLTAWVDWIQKDRLSMISAVQTEGSDRAGLTSPWLATDYFTDGSARVASVQHSFTSSPTSTPLGPGLPSYTFTSHKAQVQQQHDAYVATITQEGKDDFSYVASAIAAVQKQANQVQSLVPPTAPAAPAVATLDTTWPRAWSGATGKLRYGVQYGNTVGSSPITWSDWVDALAAGSTCPQLTLPALPPAAAQASRTIYRQAWVANGHQSEDFRATIPFENPTADFVDLDPPDTQGACPSALEPPVVVSWAMSGPAHPVPAEWAVGVRYRYRYVNTAGKSLESGPWAVCAQESLGSTADTGFITPIGGYQAVLHIKRAAGADSVEVYRQIGANRLTLNGTAVVSGRFFVFTDTNT